MEITKIRQYSPLTWVFERFFRLLQFLPLALIATWHHQNRSDRAVTGKLDLPTVARRSRRVDWFILAMVFLEVVAFALTFTTQGGLLLIVRVWAIMRIVDLIQATVNATLFDRLRGPIGDYVASAARLVVLGFLGFLELLLLFAILYASSLEQLRGANSPWDAAYFSVVTQLTIGFGDLTPMGTLKAVVVIQSLAGLTFVVLTFARTVSALPQLREVFKPKGSEDP